MYVSVRTHYCLYIFLFSFYLCSFFYYYFLFFLRMTAISQTRTISHYNTSESHSHYALQPYYAAHISPGCVHSNTCQEFTGGISDDPQLLFQRRLTIIFSSCLYYLLLKSGFIDLIFFVFRSYHKIKEVVYLLNANYLILHFVYDSTVDTYIYHTVPITQFDAS